MIQKRTGVLKIADFGTSNFNDTSSAIMISGKSTYKTSSVAGTPGFMAPEIAAEFFGRPMAGTYDPRVLDLWAAGVTIFMWCAGHEPFPAAVDKAGTVPVLMKQIFEIQDHVDAPALCSTGLKGIIEGLLTTDHAKRLTLTQLRLNTWLTDDGNDPLPTQPVWKLEVTDEEIEQAVTNRAAIARGSAAGPSTLGMALSLVGQGDSTRGFIREPEGSAIKKPLSGPAAEFWKGITQSAALAPHVPVVYSIGAVADAPEGDEAEIWIRMQDLCASMVVPCAMAVTMGSRTVTAEDCIQWAPLPELLTAMSEIDENAATPEEQADGGITLQRYLSFLDAISSTNTLGFRVDAAKVVGERSGATDTLPLPRDTTFNTLKERDDIIEAMATFVAQDLALASAFLTKIRTLQTALKRCDFFARHVLLRTCMLLTYDDTRRTEVLDLKLVDFGASYALPAGETLTHTAPWDGTSTSHEDGFLKGISEFEQILQAVCEKLSRASG